MSPTRHWLADGRIAARADERGTPVDVVVRLLVLKHMRNWSYAALEREVRSNLVYRQFTRIGAAKVPDAKTLGKLGIALGPAVIEQIHQRIVAIAHEQKVIRRAAGCAWTRPWSKPTSTTRRMRRCWATACES